MSLHLPLLLAGLLLPQADARPILSDEEALGKVVLITYELRAASRFLGKGPEYGAFLDSQREYLLELLSPSGRLPLGEGDWVGLVADGTSSDFPTRMGLSRLSTSSDVADRFERMLGLPTSSRHGDLWLWQARGEAVDTVSEAILSKVTCRITGQRNDCSTERSWRSWEGNREFSRPMLTLPSQVRLLARSLKAGGEELPAEFFWLWVQGGERFNEVNLMRGEIRRDFGPVFPTQEKILQYWDSAMAQYYLEDLHTFKDEGQGGDGLSLWRVRSRSLQPYWNGSRPLPVRVVGQGGMPLRSDTVLVESVMRSWGRLPNLGGLTIQSADEDVSIARARVRGLCLSAEGSLEPSVVVREARLDLLPSDSAGRTWRLSDQAAVEVRRLASMCEPIGAFPWRMARALGFGDRSRAIDIRIGADLIGLDQAGAFPPVYHPVALSIRHHWHHRPLGWLESTSLALALAAVGAIGLAWIWTARANTEMELLLSREDSPSLFHGPLPLQASSGRTPDLRVDVSRRRGPLRRLTGELKVEAEPLPGAVPLTSAGSKTQPLSLEPVAWLRLTSEPRHGMPSETPEGDSPATLAGSFSIHPIRKALLPAGLLGSFCVRLHPGAIDFASIPKSALDAGLTIILRLRLEFVPALPEARIRVAPTSILLPVSITVDERRPATPELSLRLFRRVRDRGIALGEDWNASEEFRLRIGRLGFSVRTDPPDDARTPPIRLRMWPRARVAWPGQQEMEARLTVKHQEAEIKPEEWFELANQTESFEVILVLPRDVASGLRASGGDSSTDISLSAEWEADFGGKTLRGEIPALRETILLLPTPVKAAISVDFGSGATRIGIRGDLERRLLTGNVALNDTLFGEPPRHSGEAGETFNREIPSGYLLSSKGELVDAGHVYTSRHLNRGTRRPSLKQDLMDNLGAETYWRLTEEFLRQLARFVEHPRAEYPREMAVFHSGCWIQGGQLEVLESFPYYLIITIPDVFGPASKRRFEESLMAASEEWEGAVKLFLIREAEAVAFWAIARDHRIREDLRPSSILVVDVGAGTVDYAVVSVDWGELEIQKVSVVALSVSRYAGKAFGRSVSEFCEKYEKDLIDERIDGITDDGDPNVFEDDLRRLFVEPRKPHLAKRFAQSQQAAEYYEEAIDKPVQNLLGRLPEGFELPLPVTLVAGRGSMLFGWKKELKRRLKSVGLSGPGEEDLVWLAAGSSGDAADSLKAAVSLGALEFLTFDQKLSASRDRLRDHIVLLHRFGELEGVKAAVVARAGSEFPVEGVVVVEDARIVLLVSSSHLPGASLNGNSVVTPELLWENQLRLESPELRSPDVRVLRALDPTRAEKGNEVRVRLLDEHSIEVEWLT